MKKEGISYSDLKPIQRKLILNYKCATCKLQTLYNLDISTRRRPKCKLCGHTVRFGRAGKFERLRKMKVFKLN